MSQNLTPQDISEIAEIMKRATIKGDEAFRYTELMNKLGQEHKKLSSPPPKKTPREK